MSALTTIGAISKIQYPYQFQQLIEALLGEESQHITSVIDAPPNTTFRFNPLKHTIPLQQNLLRNQGVRFQMLEHLPLAARLQRQTPSIGRSFSHFVGHLYIQDLSSMLPVLVLAPQPGEWVLDMCAAPGSKTTQLASMMKNRGLILANDVSVKRIRSLLFNLRRMGVKNAAVCRGFGEQYGNLYFETFHRVLLDPPCSALGTLHKSPEVLSWWTPARSEKLAGIQFRLVESGLKALKPGGVMTYSTCTITPEENEKVIDLALDRFPVELEEIHLPGLVTRTALTQYKTQKFKPELSRAIRIYPWDNQSEAFFIARLRKTGSFGKKKVAADDNDRGLLHLDEESAKTHLLRLADYYGIDLATFDDDHYSMQRDLYCSSLDLGEISLPKFLVKAGLPMAHVRSNEAKLTTEGTHLFGQFASQRTVSLPDLAALEQYVNRDPLPSPLGDLYQVLVHYGDAPIGHAISHNGRLLSRFPRAGWRFQIQPDG